MTNRLAIYYAPETGSELSRLASAWLERPDLAGETVSARRYGFHATIKAPMTLRPGVSEVTFAIALDRFARSHGSVSIGLIEPKIIDGFLALVPAKQPQALTDFAGHVVEAFEPFRAPLDPADRGRRLKSPLTPRQIELVDRYGYPYVFEEFQFHMTLTDRLHPARQSELLAEARRHFAPVLGAPLPLDRLVIFLEPAAGAAFVRGEDFVLKDSA